jgi:glycerol kinase
MPELILALDVGTTSARAAVVGPDGAFLGLAANPIASATPAPGLVEQAAETVFQVTLAAARRALAEAGKSATDIAAIGLTTQRASAVLWDKADGAPLSPLVVWNDLRGAARAVELQSAGFPLAPQQAATKLEAMLAAAEAPPSRIAWGAIDSYLTFRLTGGARHVTDRSQAWPTGYLALPGFGWNETLIAHQKLDPRIFPALVDTWGEIGTTAAFGAEIPLRADIADQQSALLAHGEAPGTAKITFGTAGAFDLATGDQFLFPGPGTPPLIVSSVEGETRFCIEGMVLSAGAALDWARAGFRLGDHAAFDALAGSVADTAGAAFLPALHGLGGPHPDPARRGGVVGLTAAVGRAHLARAAYEGLAFRAREIVDHVYAATAFARPAAIGVDGGLSRSPVFLQSLADCLAWPVRRHATPEATLLGAAIAAGRSAGLTTPTIRFEAVVEPQIGADDAEARFAAWRALVYGAP